jgi:hypothetical protein
MIGWLLSGCNSAGMARKPRVQYPGAIYPVMNQGHRREPIFREDADRERFVEMLVTVGWIADWLRRGSMDNVNTMLESWRRERRK